MTPSPGGPYRVACPPSLLARLKTWGAEAVNRGVGVAFRDALSFINNRLTTDPTIWGDPLYPLGRVGLTMYRGLRQPLLVHYAVDEPLRFVYIKAFTLLSSFGGGQAP